MKKTQRSLLNLIAFGLLAFALYLNFFYKDKDESPVRSQVMVKSPDPGR